MNIRTFAFAAALGCAALATLYAPHASARAFVGVSIGLPLYAPPPPIRERVVVRPGYVWAPGYWRWNGYRYAWAGGYWAPRRVGYRYYPARWAPVGPRWGFRAGYWGRWH